MSGQNGISCFFLPYFPIERLRKCCLPVRLALFGLLHKGKQMLVGYVRVSTSEQNTALQRDA
ncbi:TPA: hypothetical protein ACXZTO_002208, partial [Salmonella enterica]